MSEPWPDEPDAGVWETCDNIYTFAHYLRTSTYRPREFERKLRLLLIAALRAVWDHLTDARDREAVELVEHYADRANLLTRQTSASLAEAVLLEVEEKWVRDDDATHFAAYIPAAVVITADADIHPDSLRDAMLCLHWHAEAVAGGTRDEAEVLHLALFHDIFPNPFRPVAFDPSWFTPTVAALAAAIYADRAWDRMPILADALEEAGCADARVLDHCRAYPVHARGCWVVDAILGKS